MAKEVQMGLRVGEVVAVEWLESILGSRRTAPNVLVPFLKKMLFP